MAKIEKRCMNCGKTFCTYPSEIKKGGGKFCTRSCATIYRNTHNNPSWNEDVRQKISRNHADVRGEKNPMYMRRGTASPAYKDGRSSFKGDIYRKILLASGRKQVCVNCGETENLYVHHIDGNHNNNIIENLVWVCPRCHNTILHENIRGSKGRFEKRCLNKKEMMRYVNT